MILLALVLVGARGSDRGGSDAGGAYVVYGGASSPEQMNLSNASVSLRGTAAGDWAGFSVLAADVTGDERAGVIVGAPGSVADQSAGKVYLVRGGESLPSPVDLSESRVVFVGDDEGDGAGWSLDAGDVDGDGGDLLVGAPFVTGGQFRYPGGAYLVSDLASESTGDAASDGETPENGTAGWPPGDHPLGFIPD